VIDHIARLLGLVALTALLGAHCERPAPAPDPSPVPAPSDAGPAPGPVTCDDVCTRLAALGCPEAQPTEAGASCAEVCENMIAGGVGYPLECVGRAGSCAEAERCF